jgi:SAM-dependent methyltransferase
MNLPEYRASPSEAARISDLLSLLPESADKVLEIGARDGYISAILAKRFSQVVALDIVMPEFEPAGMLPVCGSVLALPFADNTFDVILCAEVLEHIPSLEEACAELMRVSRKLIVVGVPYRQDTRVLQTTCLSCGRRNPPWGHVNRFDERKLQRLFESVRLKDTHLVWPTKARTNPISSKLMDLAGNPWGAYFQDEPCVFCGRKLIAPKRTVPRWLCAAAAAAVNLVQSWFLKPRAAWIHMAFEK